MSDILLDRITGDIATINNSPVLTKDLAELVTQRLKIRLDTFLGEWFYNSEVGVPYFEEILTKRFDQGVVDGILKGVILDTEDVIRITSFKSSYDYATRKYSTDYSVTITNNVDVNGINNFITF